MQDQLSLCYVILFSLHEFASDSRKELFVRILRDLAPEHILFLKESRHEIKDPKGDALALLRNLAANGLVDEERKREVTGYRIVPREQIKSDPMSVYVPVFRISDFGRAFLKYFARGKDLGKKSRSQAAC